MKALPKAGLVLVFNKHQLRILAQTASQITTRSRRGIFLESAHRFGHEAAKNKCVYLLRLL